MQKVHYDMIYLAACGVNKTKPDEKCIAELDMEMLYKLSKAHQLEALVGMTLRQSGALLSKEWTQKVSKAIRKNVLFDAERAKLLAFMEEKKIWYLPLKGIILKDLYPALGMRQMSDNDILFNADFSDEIQGYMESQGYEGISIGVGNHDVYKKEPVYNFELHRALYGTAHKESWQAYYKDIKKRLILNDDSAYGYHFSDEDFYVYIISHAYKHYINSGTGLRTLLDFYVYLTAKEQKMNLTYVQEECKKLGIAEFEGLNRVLCKKVFGEIASYGLEGLKERLSLEEMDMLKFYLSSGVYGTHERYAERMLDKFQQKNKNKSKLWYVWKRFFPGKATYIQYPFINEHRWLLPVGCLYRFYKVLSDKRRIKMVVQEFKVVAKVKK